MSAASDQKSPELDPTAYGKLVGFNHQENYERDVFLILRFTVVALIVGIMLSISITKWSTIAPTPL